MVPSSTSLRAAVGPKPRSQIMKRAVSFDPSHDLFFPQPSERDRQANLDGAESYQEFLAKTSERNFGPLANAKLLLVPIGIDVTNSDPFDNVKQVLKRDHADFGLLVAYLRAFFKPTKCDILYIKSLSKSNMKFLPMVNGRLQISSIVDIIKRKTILSDSNRKSIVIGVTTHNLSPQFFSFESKILLVSVPQLQRVNDYIDSANVVVCLILKYFGMHSCPFFSCLIAKNHPRHRLCPVCLRKLSSIIGPTFDVLLRYRHLLDLSSEKSVLSNPGTAQWLYERIQLIEGPMNINIKETKEIRDDVSLTKSLHVKEKVINRREYAANDIDRTNKERNIKSIGIDYGKLTLLKQKLFQKRKYITSFLQQNSQDKPSYDRFGHLRPPLIPPRQNDKEKK